MSNEDENPLDMIEELAEARSWKISRAEDDFLVVHMPGLTTPFEVCLEWQEEFSALLFACTIPVEISAANYELAARTLEQINQNIWLGHFDLSNKGRHPTFRHTFLFRMVPAHTAADIVNDIFEIALAECNRFYTTFQLIQAGDVRMQDNLSAAIFETIGEA